ncbi:MMPL family transporter [Nonomuraea sp. B10E15]|uniref:MMPL family transporter n=1 Tax=Nonomuraea sp. B10E15 TaxID=3153560 RepID=UPI00325C54CC
MRYTRIARVLLLLSLVGAVLAVPLGLELFGRMTGGAEDPPSGSATAARWGEQWYAAPDVVVLYRHPSVKVRDPRYKKAVHDSLRRLPAAHVSGLATYWTTGSKAMVSGDGHATYALVTLRDGAELERYAAIADRLRSVQNLHVGVGGPVPLLAERNARAAADLARAAAVAAPVLLALLVLVSGSLVAAAVPVLAGLLAVGGTVMLLRLLTEVVEISITSLYAAAVLGFALAAGYAVFMVKAFTDTLGTGGPPGGEVSCERALGAAGRTVALSGTAVAVSLLGLLLFPRASLSAFGPVAAAVALLATGVALVVPAALLGVLGRGVAALRIVPGLWWRPRPVVPHLVATAAVLAALAVPYAQAQLGGVDRRALPAGAESRRVAEIVERGFPGNPLGALDVHVLVERSFSGEPREPGPLGQGHTPISAVTRVTASDVRSLARRLERLPHVTGVSVAGLSQEHGAVRLSVHHALDPVSAAAGELVASIRSADPGPKVREVVAGGPAAARTDLLAAYAGSLPWAALVVCTLPYALLALTRLRRRSALLTRPSRAPARPSAPPAAPSTAAARPSARRTRPFEEPTRPPGAPAVAPRPVGAGRERRDGSADLPVVWFGSGAGMLPVTVKGRPAVFGADTDPVPLAQEDRELSERPAWVRVTAGRTRVVRATRDGWTWAEVEE